MIEKELTIDGKVYICRIYPPVLGTQYMMSLTEKSTMISSGYLGMHLECVRDKDCFIDFVKTAQKGRTDFDFFADWDGIISTENDNQKNRRILVKFRGKRFDNNEIIEGSLRYYYTVIGTTEVQKWFIAGEHEISGNQVDYETLEVFTDGGRWVSINNVEIL